MNSLLLWWEGVQTFSDRVKKEGEMVEQVDLELEKHKAEDLPHEHLYFLCWGQCVGRGRIGKKNPLEVTTAKMTSTRDTVEAESHLCVGMSHTWHQNQ